MSTILRVFLGLTIITGVLYPLAVTGVANVVAPLAASGSIIAVKGRPVGSALVGQSFTADRYFWGRPSGTVPTAYHGTGGAGRNLGPTNPDLLAKVHQEKDRLLAAHAGKAPVPVDLVTASGSGLDPHISPASAEYQAERVARARGIAVEKVRELIRRHTEEPTLGLLGMNRVNVLLLNLSLDGA